jgi:glycerol-1-phosphate dehydrogenase [NAD(P)+]
VKQIVYERGAAERMAEVCGALQNRREAAVVMDTRTAAVAGRSVCDRLAGEGWSVTEIVLADGADGGRPVCDDRTHRWVLSQLSFPSVMVSVGSGVVNDLGKWSAFERGAAFVTFATAASMNGYSSANVAPAVDGVKTLVHAHPAEAIVSDPAVLSSAPRELTSAGLGDVLAKSVSSADWRLNHLLFGEEYCARLTGLIADIEPLYLDGAEGLAEGEDGPMAGLFQALVMTGAAMTMAGTSSPASGGEHLISHSLDMLSSLDGQGHDLHGRQVGVGTVLCSALYERLLAIETPRPVMAGGPVHETLWGRLRPHVAEQFEAKQSKLAEACQRLSAETGLWDRIRGDLSEVLRSPSVLHDCLTRGRGATTADDLGCDRDRLRDAFLYGRQMRSRFTVLDLAAVLGVLDEAVDELVDRWAV